MNRFLPFLLVLVAVVGVAAPAHAHTEPATAPLTQITDGASSTPDGDWPW